MKYNVLYTGGFEKQAEHYILNKGCDSLSDDIEYLIGELEKGNFIGDRMHDLKLPFSGQAFKCRLPDSTYGIGKRGGFRIIYYSVSSNGNIYLVTLYSKRDMSDIPSKKLKRLIINQCK